MNTFKQTVKWNNFLVNTAYLPPRFYHWHVVMFSLSHPSILSSHQSILFCKLQMPKHCCCSVTQSCLTLCDPTDCSTPGSLVPHHLPEFAQVHVYCTGDAISSSEALFSFCPQSFPASETFPMSSLLALDDQNTAVSVSTSVLPMNIQCWFPLRMIGLISLLSKRLSGVFSNTRVWRHQFFGILPSL